MYLNVFDNLGKKTLPMRYRTLAVHRPSGRFTLSVKAVEELGIKSGDTIALAKDEESRDDWYLTFETDGLESNSINVRTSEGKNRKQSRIAEFRNKAAAREILDALGIPNAATFIIATRGIQQDGRTWLRIITTKPTRTK